MNNKNGSAYTATYRDEIALARHFITVLGYHLAGKQVERKTNILPVDWCRLGVLGPWNPEVEEAEVVEPLIEDQQPNTPATAVSASSSARPASGTPATADKSVAAEADDDGRAPVPDRRDERDGRRRPPSALGFEVLVQPAENGVIDLVLATQFLVFTKHLPTLDEQKADTADNSPLADVTQRWAVEVANVRFTLNANELESVLTDGQEVNDRLGAVLAGAAARPDIAKVFQKQQRPKVPAAALQDAAAFAAFLKTYTSSLPADVKPLRAQIEVRASRRSDGKVRLGCYVRNDTARTGATYEDAFLILGDAQLTARLESGTLCPIEILPVPEDYQYDRRVWAVGHNTSVNVSADKKDLTTSTLARYEQPRIVTRDTPPAKFNAVAEDTFPTLDRIRREMEGYAESWETTTLGNNVLNLRADELGECRKDLAGFRDEIHRFCAGIAALKADAKLLTAFQAMNRIFGRLAKGYDAWRLFQLVFIITQLPALAVREGVTEGEWPVGTKREWKDILNWGDVLWFRTGGGKTEAYLGLTCCAMLYDRLRGKNFGITAWLRFPLRMLSVQQLQRAMKVVWETEKERLSLLRDGAKASDPIRLGYFVGSTTTPNSISADDLKKYQTEESLEALRVVPDCPACGGSGTIKVHADITQVRFRHVCVTCKAELLLDISDDEVYRNLPALIVGTIDKMASVGQQIKFGGLWGAAHWRCPEHGYAFGEYCSTFGCKIEKKKRITVSAKDPAPAFHIQDELHLLQEELGAFAGHYETLIRSCETALSGMPSKIVAATATIEGFEHQVRHLYGVTGARRFPGRGFSRLENFYMQPETEPDAGERTARIFAAFRTTMHAADASAYCTEILQKEITRLMRFPADALALLQDARTDEDVLTLLTYYTTTLNYVGSLQRGSRVSQELKSAAGRVRHNEPREMNVEYHSSRSTSAEVADLVHRVENPPKWLDGKFLDALVATNMISHGVDLERINLMTMDGVPEETAEYIQASSRSGRKHVGLVIVVLPAYSIRASSIYHRFLEYHEHLDRMVSPVPVNRFAKYAARRTLPGAVMGLIYGRHAAQLGDEKLKKRHAAQALIEKLGTAGLLEEVFSAYALNQGIYDKGLEAALKRLLEEDLDSVLLSIRISHENSLKDAIKPTPMRSLRDVEAGVPFNPDVDHKVLQLLRAAKG